MLMADKINIGGIQMPAFLSKEVFKTNLKDIKTLLMNHLAINEKLKIDNIVEAMDREYQAKDFLGKEYGQIGYPEDSLWMEYAVPDAFQVGDLNVGCLYTRDLINQLETEMIAPRPQHLKGKDIAAMISLILFVHQEGQTVAGPICEWQCFVDEQGYSVEVPAHMIPLTTTSPSEKFIKDQMIISIPFFIALNFLTKHPERLMLQLSNIDDKRWFKKTYGNKVKPYYYYTLFPIE